MKQEIWLVYHNPRCSKSRGVLEILGEKGVRPQVIEYLKTPPTEAELRDLVKKLGVPAAELVRTKEAEFAPLKLDLSDESAVLKALARHPVLIERPIVVRGQKAVIARPPEKALELL